MTSQAAPALDYAAACDKGRYLLKLMQASYDELCELLKHTDTPAESRYLDPEDLQDQGWSEFPMLLEDDNLKRLSESLGIDASGNLDVGHSHRGFTSLHGGSEMYTHFDSIINPSAGMIAATNTRSPTDNLRNGRPIARDRISSPDPSDNLTYRARDDIPDLKFWSDVAFLQWASVSANLSSLRYVIRVNITNEKTKAVVQHIMRHATSMARFPVFPGIEWYTDQDDEVAALLGTPNGAGVAWLLIQHKRQLGHKTVEKVRLVYNDISERSDSKIPSLVFKLRDVGAGELSGADNGEEVG